MISTFNALVLSFVALKVFIVDPGITVMSSSLYAASPEAVAWTPFFLGYLTCDALCTIWYWKQWSAYGNGATLVHHTIGSFAFWQLVVGGYGHFHALSCFLLSDHPLSNPGSCMHLVTPCPPQCPPHLQRSTKFKPRQRDHSPIWPPQP